MPGIGFVALPLGRRRKSHQFGGINRRDEAYQFVLLERTLMRRFRIRLDTRSRVGNDMPLPGREREECCNQHQCAVHLVRQLTEAMVERADLRRRHPCDRFTTERRHDVGVLQSRVFGSRAWLSAPAYFGQEDHAELCDRRLMLCAPRGSRVLIEVTREYQRLKRVERSLRRGRKPAATRPVGDADTKIATACRECSAQRAASVVRANPASRGSTSPREWLQECLPE